MPATELLSHLLGFNCQTLSREEKIIIEAKVITRIYEEIETIMRANNKEYFKLIKLDEEKESRALEENFLRYLVMEILTSGEYTIAGIATYVHSSEDLIYDIATGKNISASFVLTRRLINLHHSVRPRLYEEFMQKVIAEYQVKT